MPLSPAAKAVRSRIRACTRCDLHKGCKAPVPWRGPAPLPEPRLAIIAEAPGAEEDKQGRPLVGPSGQLLERLLRGVDLQPERYGYLNIVSCKPGVLSRDPKADEIRACSSNLRMQLAVLKPRWLLLVGRFALQQYRPDGKLQHAAGRPIWLGPELSALSVYHPAALLHPTSNRPALEARMRSDMENLVRMMYEDWWPDSCEICQDPVDRYGPMGEVWCSRHVPKARVDQGMLFN